MQGLWAWAGLPLWFFQSITGFGAGIFIIGILSIFYDPKMVIVYSSLFNLLGTIGLIYQNRKGKIEYYLLLSLIKGWSQTGCVKGKSTVGVSKCRPYLTIFVF